MFMIGSVLAMAAAAVALQATPNFDADRFRAGKWSCAMQVEGQPDATETATYSIMPDNHWLYLEYTLANGNNTQDTLTTRAYETFDQSLKKWVYIAISSNGKYGLSFSDGWHDGRKTYRPEKDKPQTFQLITTKKSNNEFTEDIQLFQTKRGWHRSKFLTCHRVS